MAKDQTKQKAKQKARHKKYIAKVGGNLADGSRFEAGDVLTDLTDKERAALIEMEAIEELGDS